MAKKKSFQLYSLTELQNINDETLKQRLMLEYDKMFANFLKHSFMRERIINLFGTY